MPDNKQMCKNCKMRHPPPTGRKCQRKKQDQVVNEHLRDGAQGDGQLLQLEILQQLQKVTERLEEECLHQRNELSTAFLKILRHVKVKTQTCIK